MTNHATRFAFWGRVSTEDHQDAASSRGWQLTRARQLIEPHGGQVVTEFFDIDKSRSIPPQRRPRASALLQALTDPDRGFEAVVVGEPQRAFYGSQFGSTFPLFAHYGVQLWVPEVGGPIDPDNEAHDLIMSMFGGVSKGERNRVKLRVRTAMAAQAQHEGRFLGGRPPYGHRLVMLARTPTRPRQPTASVCTRWGSTNQAAVVRRIFTEYLAGYGCGAIAFRLTADGGVPCPSAHDRERNPHRSGATWDKSAARAILLNPRYTGRQVWNRQHKHEVLIDVHDVSLGYTTKLRWNNADQWIFSDQPAHPPIIDTGIFQRVQQMFAANGTRVTARRPRRSTRPYALAGLLFCGLCHRRMHGTWANNMICYRCRGGSARGTDPDCGSHTRSVLVQQRMLLPKLDAWLADVTTDAQLPDTVSNTASALHDPDTANRAALYAQLELHLTYHPDPRTVAIQIQAGQTSTRTVIAVDPLPRRAEPGELLPARRRNPQLPVETGAADLHDLLR